MVSDVHWHGQIRYSSAATLKVPLTARDFKSLTASDFKALAANDFKPTTDATTDAHSMSDVDTVMTLEWENDVGVDASWAGRPFLSVCLYVRCMCPPPSFVRLFACNNHRFIHRILQAPWKVLPTSPRATTPSPSGMFRGTGGNYINYTKLQRATLLSLLSLLSTRFWDGVQTFSQHRCDSGSVVCLRLYTLPLRTKQVCAGMSGEFAYRVAKVWIYEHLHRLFSYCITPFARAMIRTNTQHPTRTRTIFLLSWCVS